ncbi:hypothetical protein BN2476_1250013 [Paraburkholderia piptadeniae]|uniref:Uncharacterized protein n=1 Tax=Paraburkholderia piptadeniae TaxID=1701573 RepID=A0A1N7SXH4_9BURK|nr:hypothetical protein BN2476_1250013 [Paraburkholderia piptadeniae]
MTGPRYAGCLRMAAAFPVTILAPQQSQLLFDYFILMRAFAAGTSDDLRCATAVPRTCGWLGRPHADATKAARLPHYFP